MFSLMNMPQRLLNEQHGWNTDTSYWNGCWLLMSVFYSMLSYASMQAYVIGVCSRWSVQF